MFAEPALRHAAVLAVAAHAVVLAWLPGPLAGPAPGGDRAYTFQVRQVPADAVAAPRLAEPPSPAPLAPARRDSVAAADTRPTPPAPAKPPRSREPAPEPTAIEPPPPAYGAATGPDFLPRSRLSVPPRPATSIQVPFPQDVGGAVDLRIEAALFIDSSGTVRRVRLDSDVPAHFARVIQDTFLAARFTPGEVDGRPVGAILRIEVEFAAGTAR